MFFIVLPRKFRMDQSALEFLFCCDFNWEIEGKFSRIVICEQWIKLTDFMMLDEEVKLPWRMSWNYWYEFDASLPFIRLFIYCLWYTYSTFCGFRCKIEMRQKKKKKTMDNQWDHHCSLCSRLKIRPFLAIFLEVYRKPFLVFFLWELTLW